MTNEKSFWGKIGEIFTRNEPNKQELTSQKESNLNVPRIIFDNFTDNTFERLDDQIQANESNKNFENMNGFKAIPSNNIKSANSENIPINLELQIKKLYSRISLIGPISSKILHLYYDNNTISPILKEVTDSHKQEYEEKKSYELIQQIENSKKELDEANKAHDNAVKTFDYYLECVRRNMNLINPLMEKTIRITEKNLNKAREEYIETHALYIINLSELPNLDQQTPKNKFPKIKAPTIQRQNLVQLMDICPYLKDENDDLLHILTQVKKSLLNVIQTYFSAEKTANKTLIKETTLYLRKNYQDYNSIKGIINGAIIKSIINDYKSSKNPYGQLKTYKQTQEDYNLTKKILDTIPQSEIGLECTLAMDVVKKHLPLSNKYLEIDQILSNAIEAYINSEKISSPNLIKAAEDNFEMAKKKSLGARLCKENIGGLEIIFNIDEICDLELPETLNGKYTLMTTNEIKELMDKYNK